MTQSVIVDAVRSPIGVKNGQMIGLRADDLAAQVLQGLMDRNQNIPLAEVEDISMGCAFPEGPQGMLLGRGVSILAGFPETTTANTVNRFCGSSMDSLHQLSSRIESGDCAVGIATGVEDMFSIPMGGFTPDLNPQLAEMEYYIGMGETAENLAHDGQISRTEQEQFSIASHEKALQAWSEGKFDNEIIPIAVDGTVTVAKDEGPRQPDMEKIKNLDPAFVAGGTVTAASSSPFSIGAAAILLCSIDYAQENDLTIRATIVSRGIAGVDWTHMGKGPLPASEKALQKASLTIDDIEVIELNEAFAAQSLYVIREGNWDMDKVNLNGGAIALGHPLGCSGARIITTLINVMEQRDKHIGLATMCIGTGQGITTIIAR